MTYILYSSYFQCYGVFGGSHKTELELSFESGPLDGLQNQEHL